jgi:hypothetical protein
MWLNGGELTIGVLLSFLGVAYVGAADVFGMRCIGNFVRHKAKAACCVANGVPSQRNNSRVFFAGLWQLPCFVIMVHS